MQIVLNASGLVVDCDHLHFNMHCEAAWSTVVKALRCVPKRLDALEHLVLGEGYGQDTK